MYKPVQPIRCPKCGTTVNVNTSMILTSNPPCYEWTCPNCGKKGYTKQGDIIAFENQIGRATSGYIQKVSEADPGVGVPGAVEGSLPADKRGQAAQGIHQPVRKQVGS